MQMQIGAADGCRSQRPPERRLQVAGFIPLCGGRVNAAFRSQGIVGVGATYKRRTLWSGAENFGGRLCEGGFSQPRKKHPASLAIIAVGFPESGLGFGFLGSSQPIIDP